MPTIQLPELSKEYVAIVNKTGGLVKADAACEKAFEQISAGATVANLAAANTALEAQSKKVKAAVATAGEKAAKALKQFDTDVDKLQVDIKKISKAVTEINAALR